MKTVLSKSPIKKLVLVIFVFIFSNSLFAQFENQNFAFNNENETLITTSSEVNTTTPLIQDKKGKSSFKIFAGATFNSLNADTNFDPDTKTGYMFGASFKKGRFFYYEIGARYNNSSFGFNLNTEDQRGKFSVGAIDVPITGGINLTSYVDKLIGVRLFISAIPSFAISATDIEKDNVNSFVMKGQAGVGIDIAFFFIEAGFNYGFSDLLVDDISDIPVGSSNLSQAFVGIGFRF